jgi:hypothetical protein
LCGVVSTTFANNTITTPVSLKTELKDENKDYLKKVDMKTKCLQTTISIIVDSETTNTHDVEFDNQLKKIYLSNNSHQVNSKMLMSVCKQSTNYIDDDRGYGYYSLLEGQEAMDDIYTRIEN